MNVIVTEGDWQDLTGLTEGESYTVQNIGPKSCRLRGDATSDDGYILKSQGFGCPANIAIEVGQTYQVKCIVGTTELIIESGSCQ